MPKTPSQAALYDSAAILPPALEELRDLWNYRDFLRLMVLYGLKTRYKRSVLGVLWTLLNPLLQMSVIAIAFSAAFEGPVPHYPLYVLTGLIAWNFLTQPTLHAMNNLTWAGNLAKRIHVPVTVFVFAAVGNGLVTLALSLIPLAALMLILGSPPTLAALSLPVSILILTLFSLGLALAFSALAVFFNDVINIYQILLQAAFFLTPIMYPPQIVPPRYAWTLALNPFGFLVEIFRGPLYAGQAADWRILAGGAALALCALLAGWFVFTRKAHEFAYRF